MIPAETNGLNKAKRDYNKVIKYIPELGIRLNYLPIHLRIVLSNHKKNTTGQAKYDWYHRNGQGTSQTITGTKKIITRIICS